MDFELNEEHKMLAKGVRDFMEREIEPIAGQIDREDIFPEWVWRQMGKLGWLGVTIPEEYGGSGFDYLAQAIVTEEMAWGCPALALSKRHTRICVAIIFTEMGLKNNGVNTSLPYAVEKRLALWP